jgi:competence ComEA-like helix-hairpin-helix protein
MSDSSLRTSFATRAALWLCVSFLFTGGAMAATTKKPPLHPININAADSEQSQQVPGIGPATADKILQMRKSYGALKSVDDLLAIRGIGKKRLDKMRKYLAVGKAPAATPKKPATANSALPAKCSGCAKSAAAAAKSNASSPSATTTTKKPTANSDDEAPEEEPEPR